VTKRASGDYVQDIVDAVDAAIQFVEGMTFAATIAIQIIGKTAKKIPNSIKF
jgi:uncharacterized protein with HEPN domain